MPPAKDATRTHILVFPYPAQGHMIPLLDLTHQLISRGNLTATIIVTPKNLPLLAPLLSKSHSIQTLVLPFPHRPSVPTGIENTKDLPPVSTFRFMRAIGDLHDPILNWFRAHPSPPVALISDIFVGWTQYLADEMGIPRIVFYSSGAFAVSIFNCVWHRVGPLDPTSVVSFPDIPNSPSLPYAHLPGIYRWYRDREGSPDADFARDGMIANDSSWGSVFNTFDALEGVYLEHARRKAENSRVWAVGPLLSDLGPGDRGGPSTLPAADVLRWLDGCAPRSVAYVCFGSQSALSRSQMKELAAGLDASGARFVLAVRIPTSEQMGNGYWEIPAGFEERVAGRGLVIKGWAPQIDILNHRATGAFLTHCGWNSVLEGLVAGVSLLTWPMSADQFMNARLLVEDMGVAVRVCEGIDAIPDAVELARAVAESVSGNRSEGVRAEELRKAAFYAVEVGGSSWRSLGELVDKLHSLDLKRNG